MWLTYEMTIIYLSPAKKSFLHHSTQRLAVVRCDFVAMVEGGGVDDELLVRVPDHDVGIVPNSKRTLSRLQRNLCGWICTQPSRHVDERETTTTRLSPNHRQAQLQRCNTTPGLHKISTLTQL